MPSVRLFSRADDFLYMLWPPQQVAPTVALAAGYHLRYFVAPDAEAYCALVNLDRWEDTGWRCREYSLHDMVIRAVPRGFFVVEAADGALVATAIARHRPDADTHDFHDGGEVCLVYVHPDHRGHGLGKFVTATVIQRLQAIGYRNLYLNVADGRLPALRMYLALGFTPLLYNEGISARWQQICANLNWPFGDQWPHAVLPPVTAQSDWDTDGTVEQPTR